LILRGPGGLLKEPKTALAGQAYALAAASHGLLAFQTARARSRARAPPTADRPRRMAAPGACPLEMSAPVPRGARTVRAGAATRPRTPNRKPQTRRMAVLASSSCPNTFQYIFIMASCQMDCDSAWPRGLAKVLQPEPKTALAGQAYALTAASHDLLRRPCSASAFSSP